MAREKRQHFLPVFYLKGFCDGGRHWVYYRDKNEFRLKRPKQTAISYHFYTATTANGDKDTGIERILGKIESATAPVIEKLDKRQELNSEELGTLCIFVSWLLVRTPSFETKTNSITEQIERQLYEQLFSSVESAKEFMDRYETGTGKKLKTTPERLVSSFQRGNFDFRANKNFSLGLRIGLGNSFHEDLWQLDWFIHSAPKESAFITCDSPFTIAAPPDMNGEPVGILTRGTFKIVPLSSKSCLVMGDSGDRICFNRISRSHAKWLNIHVAANSRRIVIARDREHLEKLVKLAGIG